MPAMVAATPVDEEVTVSVLRDGKEHKLPMKVGKLPSEEAKLENVSSIFFGSASAGKGRSITWGIISAVGVGQTAER